MAKRYRSPNFTFGNVGIPVGEILYNDKYEDELKGAIVRVAGKGLEITCDGKPCTLGDLTRKLIRKRDPFASMKNVQPIRNWWYNGKQLTKIYEEWKWKKRLGRG